LQGDRQHGPVFIVIYISVRVVKVKRITQPDVHPAGRHKTDAGIKLPAVIGLVILVIDVC